MIHAPCHMHLAILHLAAAHLDQANQARHVPDVRFVYCIIRCLTFAVAVFLLVSLSVVPFIRRVVLCLSNATDAAAAAQTSHRAGICVSASVSKRERVRRIF